jgi:uncharacterized repeat protein (TIGR03843 family)
MPAFPVSTNLLEVLTQGEIDIKGQFMLGSNYTFLVNIRQEEDEIQAVYKPQRGEQPLWDFPSESLAGREVAAYMVSEALGYCFVPLTILRNGPMGLGALQQYIDYNPNYHYFSFRQEDLTRLRPVALFDVLINNADRKGSHILIQKRTRKLYLIDHGLCFHTEDKLRTVLWDFAGEALSADMLTSLRHFREVLAGGLAIQLSRYLLAEEIAALDRRAAALLRACHFPNPPEDRRAYPYPPL